MRQVLYDRIKLEFMLRGKKKFVIGRGPLKRSKMRAQWRIVAVLLLVFIPWQATVLTQTSGVTSQVKQALLGESTTEGLGAAPVSEIRNLADPTHDYGIAVGGQLNGLSDEDLSERLKDIHDTGAGWLRFDLQWELVQSSGPTAYNWAVYDRIVDTVGKYQLKMIATLITTPQWARGSCQGGGCPPSDQAAFAAFAAKAAARYQPKGLQVWEVWDEPNTAESWQPKPDALAFAKLLQATYPALRMANPQAIVISGGLSSQPSDGVNIAEIDYLPQLYAAGVKGSFDALGAHPYTYPFIPSHNSQQGWSRLSQTASNLRQTMTANGDAAKKIWLTEFGAPTAGPAQAATMENHRTHDATHVDEELQAQMIGKAAELYRGYDWVGPLVWYTYADPGRVGPMGESGFGLVREDGTKKPAYSAFQKAIMGR